jgi:hypothetical protein
MRASLRLQILCAMPAEREIESAIQLAFTFYNEISNSQQQIDGLYTKVVHKNWFVL